MDKIIVNHMEFYGYHGVLPEENKLGQRFITDLTVMLDLQKAGITDQLEHSVNYADLYSICRDIVEGKPVQLIETLAERMAGTILQKYPQISEVTVRVIKPDPPIPGHYHSVAIEITRRR